MNKRNLFPTIHQYFFFSLRKMSLDLNGIPPDIIDTLKCGLAVFIERAMENIAIYVEHSHRTLITPKDVILGLKLEVFKFGQRETLEADLQNAREVITREVITRDVITREESDETDLSNSTATINSLSDSVNETEIFGKYVCTCEICSEMNIIEDKYKTWIPVSPLDVSVHSAIAKSEEKFKTSPLIYE